MLRLELSKNRDNKNNKLPIEFQGRNWIDKPNAPIAILFGFNPWKRNIIHHFIPEYRVAYCLGKASWTRLYNKFIKHIDKDQELIFIKWGKKELPLYTKLFIYKEKNISRRNISIKSVEDGFVRSIGTGLLHTRPASLCIDGKGIYFDAKNSSDLEELFNTFDFTAEQELLKRSERCLDFFKSASITKYYDADKKLATEETFKRKSNYSILVIGQVEDDASITYGKSRIKLNTDLVMEAVQDFPDADIYFKPHPDYLAKNRKSRSDINKLKDVCAILPPETSLDEAIAKVDHVYTISSLAGFDALIRGVKVTTCGLPFYSNWGLTIDKIKTKRRRRNLSITELFALSYIVYPRYVHLESDEFVSLEETASYFLFEAIKHYDTFKLHELDIFNKSKNLLCKFSTPLKLISYLYDTGTYAEGKSNIIMEFIREDFRLHHYKQISYILAKTSNYDALVEYSNYCIAHLKESTQNIHKNTSLLKNFLYALSLSLKNSNGRVINQLPDLSDSITKIPGNDSNLNEIIKNYITCCSFNLQYENIETLINKLEPNEKPSSFKVHYDIEDHIQESLLFSVSGGIYRSLTQILSAKPSRSERDIEKRHQLKTKTSSLLLAHLNKKHANEYCYKLNNAICGVAQNDYLSVENEVNKLIELIDKNNLKKHIQSKKRNKDVISIASYLIKYKKIKTVESLMELLSDIESSEAGSLLTLSYHKAKGDLKSYFNNYNRLPLHIKKSEKTATAYARTLRECGHLHAALEQYQSLEKRANTLARRMNIKAEVDKVRFCIRSSEILNSVPQPNLPKGVVFLASQTCFNTLAMMIPSLVELKKKGYAVIGLTKGMLIQESTGLGFIDKFQDSIPLDLTDIRTKEDLKNQWHIDWNKKTIESSGINFYQSFYERLSTSVRRYHVDINQKNVYNEFLTQLTRSDTCLSLCEDIFNSIVKEYEIPVTFITGNSHVTPYSIFRDFARHKNHPLVGFINCNVAYESYFSNLGSKFANTMCVTDMTLHPTIRAPFMARREQFETWYEKNKEDQGYINKTESLIKVNRVGSSSDEKEIEIIEYIRKEKSNGKKIICAFGKVPVDLNVPIDGGPAHEDMADWINHTVEVCNSLDNVVLLVKPHPHELKPEIALDLVEGFNELITHTPNDNVILLGHRDINGHALAPHLDLAILYNGSSSLELTAQGVPVLMTSHFGRYDYPVDLNYPVSREQYRNYITSGNYKKPDFEVRKKAAFLISYLGTEEISILNQYSLRQITNDKIGIPSWNEEKISHFLSHGDPKMELVASRIIEKFERTTSDGNLKEEAPSLMAQNHQ
ncbi:hypothetical protein [Oceanimonas sp. MB9]|uniref:capsular polysaccharide export protein, LipB/KpsS family n=1 Tax=Oceanimonas sp. MB9 TaxID=2588453 RepID=UPI0013F67A0D|nr:hypothetical protein [Oceanimonas sp. MB9]NHI01612.1 hypothetical protein [Oceanimonas sp. MB9]